MYKLLVLSVICLGLSACNSGNTNAVPAVCPINNPLFTQELGTKLINDWGKNVALYSPSGGKYPEVNLGAAYFTGVQYLPNAVLLPTVSPITRDGSQAIYEYFTGFLLHNPQMTNNPDTPYPDGPYETLAGCGYGVISGYYNFTFSDHEPTKARYTFQFQYLAQPDIVSVKVIGNGPAAGTIINTTQPAGWYIMLQNSAQLPSSIGLSEDLLIH